MNFFKLPLHGGFANYFRQVTDSKKGTSTNELFHTSIKNTLQAEEDHIHSYDFLNTASLSQGMEITENKKLLSFNKKEIKY